MHRTVKISEIIADAISPRILRTALFTEGLDTPKGYKYRKRDVYDYEMEFILESDGSMLIDETIYPIAKGDIVFRRPGQITQAIMPFSCYVIYFDMLGNTDKSFLDYDFEEEQEFQTYYRNKLLDAIPSIFHPSSGEKYHSLFDAVLREFIRYGEASPLKLKSFMLQILCLLYTDIKNPLTNSIVPLSPHYASIKKVVEYIQLNYARKISLEKMSEIAGLSPNYFHKLFTDTMNISPNEYLIKLKLDKAKEFLATSDISISNIAFECGFENIPYFSHLFSKRFGIPPGQFRKKFRLL